MRYSIYIAIIFLFFSCSKNRLSIDVSDIDVDVSVHRFDEVLFNGNDAVKQLRNKYEQHQQFIDVYTEDILLLGKLDSGNFKENLNLYITDSVYKKVADSVSIVFNDISEVKNEINEGFKHYKYYFPNKTTPNIYFYMSGFNQQILVDENIVGVGLESYLGADCIYYKYLGVPIYKRQKMYPMRIIPDIFYGIAATEYPNRCNSENLLSHMINEGRLMYFIEAMLPDMPDTVLMGYSKQKLKWCEKNEARMWTFLIEKKLLYSVERLDLQKFIGDGPFTNAFTQASPGKTGVWIGWQIVRSFMDKNEEISIDELMRMTDMQKLLNNSGYFPD